MEENVLKDFETFNEFPEKYLKVNKSSNCYLVNKNGKKFITKKILDSVTILEILGSQKILTVRSYYDINNGELILNTKSISNVDGINEEFLEKEENVEVNSLCDILNIDENGVYYLLKEDIDSLVNFKEENAKTYGLKPRKYYF